MSLSLRLAVCDEALLDRMDAVRHHASRSLTLLLSRGTTAPVPSRAPVASAVDGVARPVRAVKREAPLRKVLGHLCVLQRVEEWHEARGEALEEDLFGDEPVEVEAAPVAAAPAVHFPTTTPVYDDGATLAAYTSDDSDPHLTTGSEASSASEDEYANEDEFAMLEAVGRAAHDPAVVIVFSPLDARSKSVLHPSVVVPPVEEKKVCVALSPRPVAVVGKYVAPSSSPRPVVIVGKYVPPHLRHPSPASAVSAKVNAAATPSTISAAPLSPSEEHRPRLWSFGFTRPTYNPPTHSLGRRRGAVAAIPPVVVAHAKTLKYAGRAR